MRIRFALLVCLIAPVAHAADTDGRFAVDGVGSRTCEDFLGSYGKNTPLAAAYVGWTQGFFTAVNVFSPQTFDITPFQPVEMTLAQMAGYCENNLQEPYVNALGKLISTYQPKRLAAEDEVVRFESGGKAVFIYREVLQRVAERLGTSEGPPLSVDDPVQMSNALKAFQRQQSVPVTGLPDLATLNALFP